MKLTTSSIVLPVPLAKEMLNEADIIVSEALPVDRAEYMISWQVLVVYDKES
jgi:hypothetical protein